MNENDRIFEDDICFKTTNTSCVMDAKSRQIKSSNLTFNATNRCQRKKPRWLLFFSLLLLFPSVTFQKRILRPQDPCYDDDGNPRHCQPEFDNIALRKRVTVSETCGVPRRESFCRLVEINRRIERSCGVCERTGARSHPASYITDINDTGNLTYWQSKPFRAPRYSHRRNVSLTISFDKQYELSYVALQFFSPRPESMIIYKSMNKGRSWTPYQYYASDCRARFNLSNKAYANRTNEQEVLCLEVFSKPRPLSGGRVVFNPTLGRPSASEIDNSFILQDWITATDIKIVLTGLNDITSIFTRPVSSATRRSVVGRSSRPERRRMPSAAGRGRAVPGTSSSSPALNRRDSKHPRAPGVPVANPPAPSLMRQRRYGASNFYAINDLTIGGTCKCNGHASRCMMKGGRLVCDCKHNTDGVNCEKCKPFHFDRPWKRATMENANECVACNCNLHAKKCRFNPDLFAKSGGVSGGVCQKCRHHTTGRNCHFCKPGYYKNNKTKSIAHRKICKPCGCHPVGAAGKICDPTTGQCPCKEGVSGRKCNRCAKGFVQTRSRIAPCIRIPPATPTVTEECVACKRSRSLQLTLSKLCKVDFVIETKVVAMTTHGKWVRVTLDIARVFKRGGSQLRQGLLDVNIRGKYIRCVCPRLNKNRKYLMLGKYEDVNGEPTLAINKNTISLRWKNKYRRRLASLVRRTRTPDAC